MVAANREVLYAEVKQPGMKYAQIKRKAYQLARVKFKASSGADQVRVFPEWQRVLESDRAVEELKRRRVASTVAACSISKAELEAQHGTAMRVAGAAGTKRKSEDSRASERGGPEASPRRRKV